MKIVVDESVEQQIVAQLRKDGHDVVYVAEQAPGLSDDDVLTLANAESAPLLTADKDFGELVFRQLRATHGVCLVRLPGLPAADKAVRVSEAFAHHGHEFTGAFCVITPGLVRIRRQKP